jgi:hypothetical protein
MAGLHLRVVRQRCTRVEQAFVSSIRRLVRLAFGGTTSAGLPVGLDEMAFGSDRSASLATVVGCWRKRQ